MTGDWSTQDELGAASLELAHAHYRATLAVGGVKRNKLPQPLRIPRPTPWAPPSTREEVTRPPRQARRRATTPAEVAAILAAGFGSARRR